MSSQDTISALLFLSSALLWIHRGNCQSPASNTASKSTQCLIGPQSMDAHVTENGGSSKEEYSVTPTRISDINDLDITEAKVPNIPPTSPGTPRSSMMAQRSSSNTTESNDTKKERTTLEDFMIKNNNQIAVKPIGTIRSVYRLCVGTPRQGLLAPHARGRIELDTEVDAVQGLEQFSHIWIVFVFHLNTLRSKQDAVPSKIAPPALGGTKIGVLATRSPHRFNPIGMTLAKLDRIEVLKKQQTGKKTRTIVVLHLSGMDLVDGTPVLDIKPYVPQYDAPRTTVMATQEYRAPSWVTEGLEMRRRVSILFHARSQLVDILVADRTALAFYGGPQEPLDETVDTVLQACQEVLSMDVRSRFQTRKARQGKSQAHRSKRMKDVESSKSLSNGPPGDCTQQFDNLLLHFRVQDAAAVQRESSYGSGAEDEVVVTAITLIR